MFAAPNARRLRQNSWMVKIDVAEIGVKKSGADSICFQKAGSRYKTKGKNRGNGSQQHQSKPAIQCDRKTANNPNAVEAIKNCSCFYTSARTVFEAPFGE